MPKTATRETTAPHDLREIITEAALHLMDTQPELKTLQDALEVVRTQLGVRGEELS